MLNLGIASFGSNTTSVWCVPCGVTTSLTRRGPGARQGWVSCWTLLVAALQLMAGTLSFPPLCVPLCVCVCPTPHLQASRSCWSSFSQAAANPSEHQPAAANPASHAASWQPPARLQQHDRQQQEAAGQQEGARHGPAAAAVVAAVRLQQRQRQQ